MKYLLQMLLCLCAFPAMANDSLMVHSGERPWEQWLLEMAEKGVDTEALSERLLELQSDPIELNSADREQLEDIPFLSGEQVENIAYYLYRYAPMVGLSELMLIEGLDEQTIRWMLPLVCLGERVETPASRSLFSLAKQYGKQEIRLTSGAVFQRALGYTTPQNMGTGYLGSAVAHNFKYGFDYKKRLQFGFVLDKDAGEPMFGNGIRTVDQLNAHVAINNLSFVKNLVVGAYKIRFGQGLVCNQGFSMAGPVAGQSAALTGPLLSRHTSASALNRFNGIAARLALFERALKNLGKGLTLDITAFYSGKLIDAALDSGCFSSILTTGMHRTASEIRSRHTVLEQTTGAHIQLHGIYFELGISSVFQHFNAERTPPASYRYAFHPSGKSWSAHSIDGKARWKSLTVFGELGIDANAQTAWLLGITNKPTHRFRSQLLIRNYQPNYFSEYAQAVGTGSAVSNEQGISGSVSFQPLTPLLLHLLYDVYRFPELRFSTLSPSSGNQFRLEAELTQGRHDKTRLIFNHRNGETNPSSTNDPIQIPTTFGKTQLRLVHQTDYTSWNVSMKWDLNRYALPQHATYGWAFTVEGNFDFVPGWSIYGHISVFQAKAYENRMYVYERGIPGSLSIPMLYGEGVRSGCYLVYKRKKTALRFCLNESVLSDLAKMGEGLEQRAGNRSDSWNIQWSFKW